jgi:hypothetical protein
MLNKNATCHRCERKANLGGIDPRVFKHFGKSPNGGVDRVLGSGDADTIQLWERKAGIGVPIKHFKLLCRMFALVLPKS